MRSYAILPAAGHSLRMGRPKLLLDWQGMPIVQHVVRAWKASQVSEVVVVVRRDDRPLADAIERSGGTVAYADVPPPDMKASLLVGLAFIRQRWQPTPDDAWLVAPADMPRLDSAAIDAVIAAYTPERPGILVASYSGKRGHPVLLPWSLADEVSGLGPQEGLSALLARFPSTLVPAPNDSVHLDLDTPRQYEDLLRDSGP